MEWSGAEAFAQAGLLSHQQAQLGPGVPMTADLGAVLGQGKLGPHQQQRPYQHPSRPQVQQQHMGQRGPNARQANQGTHRGRSRNGVQANSQGYRRMWQQLARVSWCRTCFVICRGYFGSGRSWFHGCKRAALRPLIACGASRTHTLAPPPPPTPPLLPAVQSESGSGHGARGPAHQGAGANGFSELTVEGMVLAVRRLPPGSPVLDAVQRVRAWWCGCCCECSMVTWVAGTWRLCGRLGARFDG